MKESGDSVVEAVAAAEGVSPEDLRPPEYEPLVAAIDPEALDALFVPRRPDVSRREGTVTFTYVGYEVTVAEDGTVELD